MNWNLNSKALYRDLYFDIVSQEIVYMKDSAVQPYTLIYKLSGSPPQGVTYQHFADSDYQFILNNSACLRKIK